VPAQVQLAIPVRAVHRTDCGPAPIVRLCIFQLCLRGLTLLFPLAPASRVGHFLCPLGLSVWLLLTARPRAVSR
jgi:hypothetical protein